MDTSSVKRLIRIIALILFVTYFTYLQYRLFFFAYGHYFRFHESEIKYNLIPFKTIISFIKGYGKYSFNIWFFNLFGNVVAFIPMGYLLPIVFNKLNSLIRALTVTFLISLVLEMIQLWLRLGIADIDDVILNTIGGLVGYHLLILSRKIIIKEHS